MSITAPKFRLPPPSCALPRPRRTPARDSGGACAHPACRRFEAGDLVGILPPGSDLPRFYSLASANSDGVLEICVRKHPGGQCSSFLHELEPGGRIEAFIRKNPAFRPARGKAPLILIGAGTGIGPLAGFIRHNTGRRRVHLYWGGRDPASDFLYEDELAKYLADQRLTRLKTAVLARPRRRICAGSDCVGRDRTARSDPTRRPGAGLRRARHGRGRGARTGSDHRTDWS